MDVLWLLSQLGLDPASAEARRAVGLVRDQVTWQGCGTEECHDNPFFAGEVQPCINGQVAATGAYFGQDVKGIIERLLGQQLSDGGRNCEAENGSTRSSFNTTICVLEALLAYERASGARTAGRVIIDVTDFGAITVAGGTTDRFRGRIGHSHSGDQPCRNRPRYAGQECTVRLPGCRSGRRDICRRRCRGSRPRCRNC